MKRILLLIFVSVFSFAITEAKDYSILSKPRTDKEKAKKWAKNRRATQLFINLADFYWEICPSLGIDPVVAYCQAAMETGYGRFGGILKETYKNPCGIKTNSGGDDEKIVSYEKFISWREGIEAHVDHLALYAGAKGYPKKNTKDPRHFHGIKGTAVTVRALEKRWASRKGYGEDIVIMIQTLLRTK
ncbi:glucosaminidase domain-containing protein [Dysgonomonas sp. 511]|uniref:glucosaminidase domain-containing protein n=1 Tax=Dysgonomonas sp. 511 TaxID=2302930 RepID=UPI0013D8260E|nr:glucosaminidase domain-containing protein [Dysgonomonas sp. 511]NDV77734.1 hypothetical protein [Dysgonomonas sp. 511]